MMFTFSERAPTRYYWQRRFEVFVDWTSNYVLFFSQVTVTDRAGKEVIFPANVWLSSDPGKALNVNLAKGKNSFFETDIETTLLLRIALQAKFQLYTGCTKFCAVINDV